ncbi:MAG TPA: VWA domain-containing protein [Patescibacteria group bacterium]|jgi:Ca-activated chloride channel family protein|nr:VWA domain-containing protein [Patescibacteria group bacterium]
MRFARPELLWLLLIIPVMAMWLVAGITRRRRSLERFAAGPLVGQLVTAAPLGRLVFKMILLVVGAAFLLIAAARPQWGTTLEQVSRQGVDVMVAIDISESMLAEDIKPSRLGKAQEEASRLFDRLHGDRVGLIAFAGSAGVLCPLTLDYNAARIFLDSMTPDMISYPGSSLGSAIRTAVQAFGAEQRKFKVMLLLSDGEEQVDPEEVGRAAQEAAAQGLVIHTIGLGTPSGEPIPTHGQDGQVVGYKKDRDGRVVTTRLDESTLSRISQMTGGLYLPATAAEGELDRVAEAIGGMDKKEMQARLMTQYEERYQVPLAIGLAALIAEALISGRRRVKPRAAARTAKAAMVGLMAMMMAASTPLFAESVAGLVAEGNRLYKEGKLTEALEKYKHAESLGPAVPALHYNIGNVLYKQGEFDKAYDEYRQAFAAGERDLAEGARYNAGNSHFARKNWPDAIRNYQEALRMNPSDMDAKKNLELALLQMQEEKKKQQQKKQDQNKDDKNDQKDEQQNQQPKEQNKSPQDSGAPKPREQKTPGGEKERISREEANRILDAMKEQDRPPKDQLKTPPPDRRPEKDW